MAGASFYFHKYYHWSAFPKQAADLACNISVMQKQPSMRVLRSSHFPQVSAITARIHKSNTLPSFRLEFARLSPNWLFNIGPGRPMQIHPCVVTFIFVIGLQAVAAGLEANQYCRQPRGSIAPSPARCNGSAPGSLFALWPPGPSPVFCMHRSSDSHFLYLWTRQTKHRISFWLLLSSQRKWIR